jgi:ADP-L-glycero-D-manno-heptose 6-epimerase
MSSGIQAVIHMGACSSTTEQNVDYLKENNFLYTRSLAEWCLANGVRYIYASSGATYGDGSNGFSDADGTTRILKPINHYGNSKQLFDLWVLEKNLAASMAGIKFFNVFGPNEYHKGDMTSVIFKAFNQIKETGRVRLFKSYKPEYGDGEQKRDFVYIKDCLDIMWWFLKNPDKNGIFNLGTGNARTWNDLVAAVFKAMKLEPSIEYIDMPAEIIDSYQYFTQADMSKLKNADAPLRFRSLEQGIEDYVVNYLQKDFACL